MIAVMAMFAWPAAASAAGGTAMTTLTPNTSSASSSASVSITGLSGVSGLPSSIALLLQPGFSSSVMSVPVLCTAAEASSSACPTGSQIGTASAGVTFLGLPIKGSLTAFLGAPLDPGDVASVILSGSLDGTKLSLSGRLFVPSQGGLELLLSGFPSEPVTLESLALTVDAVQTATQTVTETVIKIKIVTTGKGKHKHRHKKKIRRKVEKTITTTYSLITNPPSCSGAWTGTVTLSYSTSADTLPLSIPCATS